MASSLPWEFYDSLDSARVDLDHAHGTGRSGLWIVRLSNGVGTT